MLSASEITLLVSGDGRGNLNPVASDYTGLAFGGLAQRASAIEDYRNKNDAVLLVEAGNFLFGANSSNTSCKSIVDSYAAMGYDAINVGTADFRRGKSYTEDLLNNTKLPIVSANLLDQKGGKRLFQPFLLVKRGGENTAILGLTEPPLTRSFLPYLNEQLEGIYFQSIQESLGEWLPIIEKKARYIVILYAGSSVGLQQIRQIVTDKVDIIASAGPGPVVTAIGGKKPVLLAPLPQGRELTCAVLSKNKIPEKSSPVLITSSLPPESKVKSLLKPSGKNNALITGSDDNIIVPTLKRQAKSLPPLPKRNHFYQINGSMSNRGADIEFLSAGFFDQFGTLKARDGHILLVLRNAWKNTIPLILKRNQGLATTYLIPNLGDHLYTVVNGKHMSRIYTGEETIPGQLPVNPLSLPYLGMRKEGTLVFELQDEAMDSIQLRMYDYAHGHDQYDLLGTPPSADEPVFPTASNKVVNVGIFEFIQTDTIAGTKADPGTTFAVIDLRATSKFTIDGDATAFDPHAKPGSRIEIGTVADWLEADKYNHLIVDGQYAYKPLKDLSLLEANPRFLPDLKTGNRLVFQIPADHQSLTLRADFPNAKLPDGTLIRPEPISFELSGTPQSQVTKEPIWKVVDDTINMSVMHSDIREQFAGTQADAGNVFLVLDVEVEGTGEKPEFFQANKQLVSFDAKGRKSLPHEVTFQGILHPTETVWVPNGEIRSFQVVFEVDAQESEHRISYQGYSLAETVALTSNGDLKEILKGTESETIEPIKTKPIVSQQSKEVKPKEESSEVEVIEEQEPEEIISLIPYHLAKPKALKIKWDNDLKARLEIARAGEFLPLDHVSYTGLQTQFGEPLSIDSEAAEDEDQAVYQLEIEQLYEGTLETKGQDLYQFVVTEEQAEGIFNFYIAYDLYETDTKIQIESEKETLLQQYVSEFEVVHHFKLNPGTHSLEIYNNYSGPDKKYRIYLESKNAVPGNETEFNNQIEYADELKLNSPISGRISKGDNYDYFKIQVDEQAAQKVHSLDVISNDTEATFEITIYSEDEDSLASVNGKDGVASIGNFSPTKGTYFILITRINKDFAYQLNISEKGNYVRGNEREPNDSFQSPCKAIITKANQDGPEMSGVFNNNEQDYFQLDVKDPSKIYTLSLSGKDASRISYLNPRGRRMMDSRESRDLDLVPALIDIKLPVGLNTFMVEGKSGDWSVNVESFTIPDGNFEEEPNDKESWATGVRLGEMYSGRLLNNSDEDNFKVTIHKAMNYRFTVVPGKGGVISMLVYGLATGTERYKMEENDLQLDKTLYLVPGQYRFYIEGDQPSLHPYELSIEPVPVQEKSNGISFEIQLDSPTMAEHSDLFQFTKGVVTITNNTDSTIDGQLGFQSTHNSVSFSSKTKPEITLQPGASLKIPVEVHTEANAWCRSDIFLYVQIASSDGLTYLSDKYSLILDPDQLPVGTNKTRQSSLLPELIGGLNLASLMLGASVIEEENENYPFDNSPPDTRSLKKLFDEVIELDSFWGHRAIIKLAGDGAIPLKGTSFELHGEGSLWESAKDITIEMSDDGQSWSQVFEGVLAPRTGNQQFLFPKEITAQYARLTIKSTHSPVRKPHLGEWRIIANPGVSLGLHTFDLLDSKNGAHLIRKTDHSRIFGFHHNRAAKMSGLGWEIQYPSNHGYQNGHNIKISTSMDSPVGPWQDYGEFDVSAADNAEKTPTYLNFNEPTWARFVKIEWDDPSAGIRSIIQPEKITLTELKHSNEYYSILGEWGDAYSKAGYEYFQTNEKQTISHIHSSQDDPFILTPNHTLSSAASIGEGWEDWLRIEPLQSEKRIELHLQSEPFIKVAVDISDSNGNPIDVSTQIKGSQNRTYTFIADPNMQYRVHIYEPKRSIVFLWDVSGSMGSFVPSIENAILQFAAAVNPKTEIVHLLPFEDKPKFLLEDWTGDPYLLSNTVRYYNPPHSSYAHMNLLEATKKLKDQKGTKAAIVITDCESSRDVNDELWDALEEVRPVVFTFQTSDRTSQYDTEQDDMQDWASVAGGFYRSTRNASELDVAFEKVKAFLRRPAPYSLSFATPELKPGFIEVKDAREKETIIKPEEEGVLLIIDASASMREKLPDGQMKVTVAKKVIEMMVNEYLPAETNFGMRVFGHRGGENCMSELMIPVAKLDPTQVKQKLMFVRSSSLGNTSLAEGLSWAKEDLKAITGQKRVVVLTDGEETCRGDPAQEIAELAAEGLDVVVNIVGFTLGDDAVKAEYSSWVKSTDGNYYDAQDSLALGEALKKAMTPKTLPDFNIIDKEGNIVAIAQVGSKPIKVKSGKYTVEILDSENPKSYEIEVMEKTVSLDYQ